MNFSIEIADEEFDVHVDARPNTAEVAGILFDLDDQEDRETYEAIK